MRDGVHLTQRKKVENNISALIKHTVLNDRSVVSKRDPHYWRKYYIPGESFATGASGATFVAPSASTLGGYQLDANTEYLYYHSHVEPDWDGGTDLTLEVFFEVNVDNTGGADADTVDIQLIIYYKGEGDTTNKTQTTEVATIVGKSARYKLWKATFTVDHDLASHVVDKSDIFGLRINLETDTSEVDNIVVCFAEFKYKTWKPAPEVNP